MTPKTGDKFRLFGLLWEVDFPSKDGFRAVHEDKTEFLRVMYLKYAEAEYLDWVQPDPWWIDYVAWPEGVHSGVTHAVDIEKILAAQKEKIVTEIKKLYPDMSYRSGANEVRSDLLDEVFKKIENV